MENSCSWFYFDSDTHISLLQTGGRNELLFSSIHFTMLSGSPSWGLIFLVTASSPPSSPVLLDMVTKNRDSQKVKSLDGLEDDLTLSWADGLWSERGDSERRLVRTNSRLAGAVIGDGDRGRGKVVCPSWRELKCHGIFLRWRKELKIMNL